MQHNNDNAFIDIHLDQVEEESEKESEVKIMRLSDDDEITCSKMKYVYIFLVGMAISLPTFIHVLPAIFYPNKTIDTNTINYKSLVKFEISYELFLLAAGLYFTSPIWYKFLVENSPLQSQSLFRHSSLSGSFGKNQRDAEANDDTDFSSDCEMENRVRDLTRSDISINAETPLRKSGQRTTNYTSI